MAEKTITATEITPDRCIEINGVDLCCLPEKETKIAFPASMRSAGDLNESSNESSVERRAGATIYGCAKKERKMSTRRTAIMTLIAMIIIPDIIQLQQRQSLCNGSGGNI